MKAIICLATYNGARWLPAQLDSLLAQEDTDWRLLVRDDGSTDETRSLLQRFAESEGRCELLPVSAGPGSTGPGGACANFEALLHAARERAASDTDAFLLCDQDDRWAPEKLRLQQLALRAAPATCSELRTIDEAGVRGGAVLAAQKVRRAPTLASLLAQNSVVGCTLALRREVLDLALPFPPDLINHDWWLALCAATLGEIHFSTAPLVFYRQHEANAIGAYRPSTQWLRLPALLRRQRRVLASQLLAVRVLHERLQDKGMRVDQVLRRYVEKLERGSASARLRAMLSGEFAAPHKPLRLLRAAAVTSRLR